MLSNKFLNAKKNLSSPQMKRASMALDDLVWLLQRLDIKNLVETSDMLRELLTNEISSPVASSYQSSSPNKNFLIGVLPRLFQDKALFPQNDDIAEFANVVLNLEMSRTEKRSRYEIIGKVVCETDTLSENELTNLVQALERLVEDKEKLKQVAEKKMQGTFSWNETLQELLRK